MSNTGNVVKSASRVGGGIFGKLFKYKLFSFFVIYVFISILSFGFSTGDWSGAVIKMGDELINPLQDTYNKLVDLNAGTSGFFNAIVKISLVYFAFYKIWIWFRLVLLFINFLMKDANAPFIRIIISLILFFPIFYFVSSFYSVNVLGEGLFYPFELTKGIWLEFIKIISNPSVLSSFELKKENVCSDLSGCVV